MPGYADLLSPISATLGVASGLGKGAFGLWQYLKGTRMGENNPRPELNYQIPQAATDALNVYKGLASNTRLAGQEIAENRIGNQTANAVGDLSRVSTSGADIVNNINKIYANQAGATADLDMAAAENYQNNQRGLAAQENNMAQWQDKKFSSEWDWNKARPFTEKAAAASALTGAGIQNISSGAGDIFGSSLGYFGSNNSTGSPNQDGFSDLMKYNESRNRSFDNKDIWNGFGSGYAGIPAVSPPSLGTKSLIEGFSDPKWSQFYRKN